VLVLAAFLCNRADCQIWIARALIDTRPASAPNGGYLLGLGLTDLGTRVPIRDRQAGRRAERGAPPGDGPSSAVAPDVLDDFVRVL